MEAARILATIQNLAEISSERINSHCLRFKTINSLKHYYDTCFKPELVAN